MKLLVVAGIITFAVSLVSGAATKIDECTCWEKGNYYSPVTSNGCRSFTQRTAWLPPATHRCPANLVFDVNECVCNWPANATPCPSRCPIETTTPPPPPKSCYRNGNTYAPVPGTDCAKFTQATATLPPQQHSCPAGLAFDVGPCVCNWPWAFDCEA